MNLDRASELYGFPLKVLRSFQRDGIISNPLADHDRQTLAAIKAIWARPRYLSMQLSHFPEKRRYRMALMGDRSTMEKWIISRYLDLRPGERLSVDAIAREVCTHFRRRNDKALKELILRLRKKVYHLRSSNDGPHKSFLKHA